MTTAMRTVYAQSNDIRSRTCTQYRLDMKKKAIAELEFLPFLQRLLAARHNDSSVRVRKHGGDALLWFAPKGRVSQDPDYQTSWSNGKSCLYEFQLAEATEKLRLFDFKEAKVGKKLPGRARQPHTDREFFYIIKDTQRYAFIPPEWIAENGTIGSVTAWGSRSAYCVPRDIFLSLFADGDADLARTIAAVDDKNYLLEFQSEFMEQETRRLSRELQQVVDDEKLLSIVPRTLDGFYRVCYLLDKIGKQPDAPGVWLVYLASFFNDSIRAIDFARYIYALDFLYFKCANIQENERTVLQRCIAQAVEYIGRRVADTGALAIDPRESPLEETRQVLFAINLLEDLKQDAVVNCGIDLPAATKIFEIIPDAARTASYIRNAVE